MLRSKATVGVGLLLLFVIVAVVNALPENPSEIAFYNNTTSLNSSKDAIIVGNYLYVTSQGGLEGGASAGSLTTFDISGSNARNPTQTANTALVALRNSQKIANGSGYIYVNGYYNHSILTFNISGSNAANPQLVATYRNETHLNAPYAMRAVGGYLYAVSVNNYTLMTLNISGSNAANPQRVASYYNGSSLIDCYDMEDQGDYLYVICYGSSQIVVFNITGTKAANPTYVRSVSTATPSIIERSGNFLYVFGGSSRLRTYNISGVNASFPALTNTYTNSTILNGVGGLSSYGGYLYSTATSSKALATFNIAGANASVPQRVASYINTTSLNFPRASVATLNYLYVVSSTTTLTTFELVPAATTTCTYGGSGDWVVNIADNCTISTNVALGANSLIINGTGGTFNVAAGNTVSAKQVHLTPTDYNLDFIVNMRGLAVKP